MQRVKGLAKFIGIPYEGFKEDVMKLIAAIEAKMRLGRMKCLLRGIRKARLEVVES